MEQETAGYIWRCGGKVVLATVCPARIRIVPARAPTTGAQRCADGCYTSLQERHPACHERYTHVLLLLTGESEYFCSHLDEWVKAMMKIPPGEIMGRVHMADRSDKAPAMKGIEALPCRGHNHVCEIAISVDRSSANQLMTTMFSDGP